MAEAKRNYFSLPKALFFALGASLLFFLIWRVGYGAILSIIARAKIIFLLAGLLVYLILIVSRAFKWFLLLRAAGQNINYKEFLPCYLTNCLLSNLTPFKSGEAISPLILRKYLKVPFGQGISVVIFDRFFELMVFTVFLIAAALYLIKLGAVTGMILTIIKLALAAFIILILFLIVIIASPKVSLKIIAWFKPWGKYSLGNRILTLAGRELQVFYASLSLFKNKKVYQKMIPLTVLAWLLEFLSFYLVFTAVVPAAFFQVAAAQTLSIAATLVTFIPAGLGVGELGVVYILTLFNYSVALSAAGALLARLVLTGSLLAAGIAGSFLLKEKAQ